MTAQLNCILMVEDEPDIQTIAILVPGMDGHTTPKELRRIKQLSLAPVIFMTAKVQFHEIEGYKNLGTMGAITKPFDPMQLSNIVMRIWSKNNV